MFKTLPQQSKNGRTFFSPGRTIDMKTVWPRYISNCTETKISNKERIETNLILNPAIIAASWIEVPESRAPGNLTAPSRISFALLCYSHHELRESREIVLRRGTTNWPLLHLCRVVRARLSIHLGGFPLDSWDKEGAQICVYLPRVKAMCRETKHFQNRLTNQKHLRKFLR